MRGTNVYIHPTAVVDEGCEIGPGTHIWHFCHVMEEAVIGPDCTLGQNTFVAKGVRLGARCKIQNNVSIFAGVTCDEDVFLGPSCVFTNVTTPRSAVNRKHAYEDTHLNKGVTIGANATILCGITLGIHAFVGAGAVVTDDVPDHALVLGNPGRIVGWMCRCGERLKVHVSDAWCLKCGALYRTDLSSKVVVASETTLDAE